MEPAIYHDTPAQKALAARNHPVYLSIVAKSGCFP
jgi:hypothetical protein